MGAFVRQIVNRDQDSMVKTLYIRTASLYCIACRTHNHWKLMNASVTLLHTIRWWISLANAFKID